MKALVLTRALQLELWQRDIPVPEKDEVIIRIAVCGVCGTDHHLFQGQSGAAPNPFPIILGHEFSGVVAGTGPEVKNIKEGDRVCVDPNCACGQCEECLRGRPHFCRSMVCYGTTTDGGFAEYCKVREKAVYRLPDSVSFEEGAMVEPVACCLHGMDRCGLKPGETVAIIGCGPIGQIMVQLAKRSGADRIIVIEPIQKRREMALAFGADLAFDPTRVDIKRALSDEKVQGPDHVIECVGQKSTMSMAIELTGRGGTAMLFGLTAPEDEISIRPFDLFQREISVLTSYINPYTTQRVINLIAARKISLLPLITHRVPIDQAIDVFTKPANGDRGKVLIMMGH